MSEKIWKYRTQDANPLAAPLSQEALACAEDLGISAQLWHLLSLRGFVEPRDIELFLSPHVRHLAPPKAWPGVLHAAELICASLLQGDSFVVWGDYDVDGITAAALVMDVLEYHGFHPRAHIPHRTHEGYGLNIPSIEALAAENVRCLLTVDCGISDVDAVACARELGMTVIISDHHLPPEVLPPAHGICNPRLGVCPCPQLAGVGMAFYLMAAVNTLLLPHTDKHFDMRSVLDLVALGSLADVVRLIGQNRILVKNGLLKIAEASRPGIAALKSVCRFAIGAKLNAGQVVFTMAPRINAAGRMGQPHIALDALRARDYDAALILAQRLDAMNTERRVEEENIHQEARTQAENYIQKQDEYAGLVLYAEHWHPGIIGIVASRIVDEFHRPTLILCKDNEVLKGSGRSIPVFDLHAGLTAISSILLGYGGHKQAAGLRIAPENLPALRTAFDAIVRQHLGDDISSPILTVESDLDFALASNALFVRELELLQPFGQGNAEPIFVSPWLRVRDRRVFGYQRTHVVLDLTDEDTGITLSAKAWRMAESMPESLRGKRVRLAYTPYMDTYNGTESIEVRIRDWTLEEETDSVS